MAKDSLVKGTLILTAAALIARFIGVFQKIPLVHLLGDKGMGSYTIAFNLYSMLLVIATAGIPSALSKMVSEKTELGRQAEAERIYRAAALFALVAGFIMAVLLFVLAPWYARDISGDPNAILATRAIAPALLFFPLIAIMRGYFQGKQRMMPNGISQVVEQIFRLITAVVLAFVLLSVSLEWAIAGASFGGAIGGIAAFAVMSYFARKMRRENGGRLSERPGTGQGSKELANSLSYKTIYKNLLKLSIPIVFFSITVTFIYTIDSSIIIPLLRGELGEEVALELVGILGGRAQSLAGIPIILAIALSQSIVPIISAAYARKDIKQVANQTSRTLQLAILSGLPMVLFISIAARPLDGFIFGYEESQYGLDNGPYIVAFLTMSAMFQIIMQTSGAVLMGLGRMKPLVLHVIIGISIKLIGSFMLSPWLGIYGIVASTGLCFIVMSWLNIAALRRSFRFKVLGTRRLLGLMLSIVVIAVVGVGAEILTHSYVHPFGIDRLNEGVNSILVGCVVLALYPLMIMATRVVTKEDVKNFPAPLQKLIAKAGRLIGRR
ncbi:putative polysaccharide biosynthesis protein [Paenibacillus eucommiae]|uniref:Stage V sporulation protein B n=1 Tax=Paenibacillus eucommiae TaxID=1355755 RepID=A0ABS4IWR7_9BACL|nr:polysaccharide biosynthesis protein [Paenibacillus eucommiae]MBP1992030.1 stage V sporulation protein B [Paenibacillus eucommiae]